MSRVHVTNVPPSVTLEQFVSICRKVGAEGGVRFARDPHSGCFAGKAYIECQDREEALSVAAQLHDLSLAGSVLVAEAITTSGYFDDDGLFADGQASIRRRDGED